jgi:hypothetical protein
VARAPVHLLLKWRQAGQIQKAVKQIASWKKSGTRFPTSKKFTASGAPQLMIEVPYQAVLDSASSTSTTLGVLGSCHITP